MYELLYFIDGTVCAQDGSFISVESGCSHVGEIDICKGKVTGDCGCGTLTPTVTPTVPLGYCRDGERFCNSQCECGKGYYECEQGRWIERPLPSILLILLISWYCMCTKWNRCSTYIQLYTIW